MFLLGIREKTASTVLFGPKRVWVFVSVFVFLSDYVIQRKKARNDVLTSILNENFTVVVMFGLEHKVWKSTHLLSNLQ